MPFKPLNNEDSNAENPQAMFRDLRPRTIEALYSHQDTIINSYVNIAKDHSDVALQLPTGSGKTLVGLLIAEWRRRTMQERVVFLCPTKQLVNQISTYANNNYGIKSIPFTGKTKDYSPTEKTQWNNGESIAVTTYSALFNTNPFFDDPNLILLDDAHSAESYIASTWTLDISIWEHPDVFGAIAPLFRDFAGMLYYDVLKGNAQQPWERNWVKLVPFDVVAGLKSKLEVALTERTVGTNLRFPWSYLHDKLSACLLLLGCGHITIRPILPPTHTHKPFQNAAQRIYMSATLGEGGELERISGRKKIMRLPVPKEYSKHSVGRRFFLTPGASLEDNQQISFLKQAIEKAGRSLILVPSDREATNFGEIFKKSLPEHKIFDASEIEKSKSAFTSRKKAIAIAANRFDGIDFPKDECRLLVVGGMPRAVNLLERFYVDKLGALNLLNERVRTRIVQAFGRCTRSDVDYAGVIVLGEELLTYLTKREGRKYFHPELQAEIEFGIAQSKSSTESDLIEMLDHFFAQDNDWQSANKNIVAQRDKCTQHELPASVDLRNAAPHEIEYVKAVWFGDYQSSLLAAQNVLAAISNPSLKGYRALWNYLAGTACVESGDESLKAKAKTYFIEASKAAPSISFLQTLATDFGATPAEVRHYADDASTAVIERLEATFEDMGALHPRNLELAILNIEAGLKTNEAAKFEEAQKSLGALLGYQSGRGKASAEPDSWWIADQHTCFVFEDHTEATTEFFSVSKARQAMAHRVWAKSNLNLDEDADFQILIITTCKDIDQNAKNILRTENISFWHLDEYRDWAQKALESIRVLHSSFPGSGDLIWRESASGELNSKNVSPNSLKKLANQLIPD